jgi:hypothetical protein
VWGSAISQARNQHEAGRKQAKPLACCLLNAGFLLGSLFNPEDKAAMFLRNVGSLSTGYTALYPRRENSS